MVQWEYHLAELVCVFCSRLLCAVKAMLLEIAWSVDVRFSWVAHGRKHPTLTLILRVSTTTLQQGHFIVFVGYLLWSHLIWSCSFDFKLCFRVKLGLVVPSLCCFPTATSIKPCLLVSNKHAWCSGIPRSRTRSCGLNNSSRLLGKWLRMQV